MRLLGRADPLSGPPAGSRDFRHAVEIMKTPIGRVVVAFVLLATSARATVLVPATMGELARDAGAIVRGRVIAAEARFTPDRRAIETLALGRRGAGSQAAPHATRGRSQEGVPLETPG